MILFMFFLIMELWQLQNVVFYRSFLQFSLLIRKFYFSVCESPIQSTIIERRSLQGCHFPAEERLETSSGYTTVGHFVSCVLHDLALL